MKRDLPEHVLRERHDVPWSMLTSRTFWVGGLLSMAVWATLLIAALR